MFNVVATIGAGIKLDNSLQKQLVWTSVLGFYPNLFALTLFFDDASFEYKPRINDSFFWVTPLANFFSAGNPPNLNKFVFGQQLNKNYQFLFFTTFSFPIYID